MSFETKTIEPVKTLEQSSETLAGILHAEKWSWTESNEPYTPRENPEASAARTKAKEDFIQNPGMQEPEIEFPDIDINEVQDAILRYDKILHTMHTKERGEEGEFLYEHAARKIAELVRLKTIYDAQATSDLTAKQRLREQAVDLSVALFGEPDKKTLSGMISVLCSKANQSDSPYATGLLSLLPFTELEASEYRPQILKQETIDVLHGDILELFAPAFTVIEEIEDPKNIEDALDIIQRMIDAMGLEGAKAKKTTNRALGTNGRDLTIELGEQRTLPTKATLRTTGIHELIHLLGYYRARKEDPNTIRGLGMPGTLNSEEGKSLCVEQIINGVASVRGENYYLATGLFLGIVDGRKRNFREVYEVMWRRLLVQQGKEDDVSVKKAKNTAYDTVMRTYRGLACDTRDTSYYEGNASMSSYLDEIAQISDTAERRRVLWEKLSTRAEYSNGAQVAYLSVHPASIIPELDNRVMVVN